MITNIYLLGRINLQQNNQPSPLSQSPKGCALLIYLLLNEEPQSRRNLASLLWDDDQSLAKLRDLLRRIRPWLPDAIKITRGTLAYHSTADLFVDVHALQAGLQSSNMAQLEASLGYYKGDLAARFYLPDNRAFNEWLAMARENFRRRVLLGYDQLCSAYAEQQKWDILIHTAQRWLELDEFDEQACLWCMRGLAEQGAYESALITYTSYQARLWAELGVEAGETAVFAQQLQQLQQTKPQSNIYPAKPPSPDTHIPYRLPEQFVGRQDSLNTLVFWLDPKRSDFTRAAIIAGMGGVGKTQLAVMFAYQYGGHFTGGVHWLNMEEADAIPAQVIRVGQEMGILAQNSPLSMPEQLNKVQQAWQEATPRLLIFDNCEDEAILQKWLPVTGGCRVLVTSRRANWSVGLPVQVWPLGVLTAVESQTFLQTLCPHLNHTTAQAIAHTLGHLPLALHLAGHTLAQSPTLSPETYLHQLQQKGVQHPSLQGSTSIQSPTNHRLHVQQTFALNQLYWQDANGMAQQLLERAACLAHGEPIPVSLLQQTIPNPQQDMMRIIHVQDGLDRLLNWGFLQKVESSKVDQTAVVLHRLLASLIPIQPQAQTDVAHALIRILQTQWQEEKWVGNLPFPVVHLQTITHKLQTRQDALVADLQHWLGSYWFNSGNYQRAEETLLQSARLKERLWGVMALQTAVTYEQLGQTYMRLSQYKQSKKFHQLALEARQKTGHNQVLVADSLNALGKLYWEIGDYQQAQLYIQQTLDIQQQILPSAHVDLSDTICLLGTIYSRLGQNQLAQQHLSQGLQIQEKILGGSHPTTMRTLNNLGALCVRSGQYTSAQLYFEQALTNWEQTLGVTHLTTIKGMSNLAFVYALRGYYVLALRYAQRALHMRQTHPHTSASHFLINHNIITYIATRYGDEALTKNHLQQAQLILQTDSTIRPSAISIFHQRSGTFHLQYRRLTEAEAHFQSALKIHQELFGERHAKTIQSQMGLSKVLLEKGELTSAEKILTHLLPLQKKIMGEQHPKTAVTQRHLAQLYYLKGEHQLAEQHLQQALTIQQAVLRPDHPEIGITLLQQATWQPSLQRLQQILPLLEPALLPTHPALQQAQQLLAYAF